MSSVVDQHMPGMVPNPLTSFLFDFQKEAYDRALARLSCHKAVYLALDPGLGKTLVSLTIGSNFVGQRVYVCPAGLKANVYAEMERFGQKDYLVLPDSKLWEITPPETIDLLVIDEAHRFSNPKSQRSKALFALAKRAHKVVLLSGTPTPNARPAELWSVLENFAPELFGRNFFAFAQRYCGAKKTRFGWDFTGFTNREEFQQTVLESFMVRMRKDRIKLPAKREGFITVSDELPPSVRRLEKRLLEAVGGTENDFYRHKVFRAERQKLLEKGEEGPYWLHVATYLRLLGEYKLKHSLPIIETLLFESKEKLLLFAIHQEVVDGLKKALTQFQPLVLTGKTPSSERKKLVDAFQADPKKRVFILNVNAGGIGWNLTEADRVIFVEFSWRDGDNSQAADRANRIGSKKPVLVQYVVLKDSYDAKRLSMVLSKRALSF